VKAHRIDGYVTTWPPDCRLRPWPFLSPLAYVQLAGFPPVVGLYASILPLVAYAALGSSRQLIVNPNAATCAMIAAIVTPLILPPLEINVDREFIALGACSIAACESQGLAFTGADSRTAMVDAAGGNTQITGAHERHV